jgi:hypothetical protein
VFQQVRKAADLCGHEGFSAGHEFQGRAAVPFRTGAGDHPHIQGRNHVRDVFPESGALNTIRDLFLRSQSEKAIGTLLSFLAYDHETEIGTPACQLPTSANQILIPFHRIQVSDSPDQECVSGDA